MKLKTLIMMLAVSAFSFSAFSQTEVAANSATAKRMSLEEAAKLMQMRITRVLNLDAATSAKLYEPALAFFKEREALKSVAVKEVNANAAVASNMSTNNISPDIKKQKDEVIYKRDDAFKSILGNDRYNTLQAHIREVKHQAEQEDLSSNPDAILMIK